MPRRDDSSVIQPKAIYPGDSGIWATCDRGREAKCIGELKDLFAEYADILYGDIMANGSSDEKITGGDIESDIRTEIDGLHHPGSVQLFAPVRLDVQCGMFLYIAFETRLTNATVVFMKTTTPVEPVAFIRRICEDAMNNSSRKRTRFVKRLTPMTLMGRASADGLEKVAQEVLAPHFHQQPFQRRKVSVIMMQLPEMEYE